MPIVAVVGAQFGSEGKGKISAYLAPEIKHSVRTGGPNAGHTVVSDEESVVFRHLPCASINDDVLVYLGAGAIIDVNVLSGELEKLPSIRERLMIDPQAAIITQLDLESENALTRSIGSTGKGVGAALQKKLARDGTAKLARHMHCIQQYLGPVSESLCKALQRNEVVMLEGTQGTGLSLHHGNYPFVTSRDVTVGSLCGECGVPPTAVRNVYLVVRPFPIRVAGNSGPMYNEISWEDVKKRSGSPNSLVEYTTVTGLVRRVGEFDLDSVRLAAAQNGATDIALTFADHLNAKAYGMRSLSNAPREVASFIDKLESELLIPVSLVSTGPKTNDIIDRRY